MPESDQGEDELVIEHLSKMSRRFEYLVLAVQRHDWTNILNAVSLMRIDVPDILDHTSKYASERRGRTHKVTVTTEYDLDDEAYAQLYSMGPIDIAETVVMWQHSTRRVDLT